MVQKRRKTLQISEIDDSKEEIEDKGIEKVVGEGRTSTRKKA